MYALCLFLSRGLIDQNLGQCEKEERKGENMIAMNQNSGSRALAVRLMCGREGFYPSTCPVKGESLSQTFNKPLGVMFPEVTVFSGVFSCTVD